MADEKPVPGPAGVDAAGDQFRLPPSTADPITPNAGSTSDTAGVGPTAAGLSPEVAVHQDGGTTTNPPQSSATPSPAGASGNEPGKLLGQDDIDMLLKQAGLGPPASTVQSPPARPRPKRPERLPAGEGDIAPDDLDLLFNQAQRALASIDADHPRADPPPGARPFQLEQFAGAPASTDMATLDLVRDVELDLRIELGRTHLYLEDVLRLRRGSVVPLDKMAGDPVDVFVNGRLIARGEVLVLNDNFCVRVAELVAGTGPG
jgi:flagellar motor switch protein FliN